MTEGQSLSESSQESQGGALTAATLEPPTAEAHAAAVELARVAARAADAKKATDVVVLDLSGVSDVCEAIVAATAANSRLADSVVDEVEACVRLSFGVSPLSIEGRSDGRWILIDYGSVIVHLFTPEARDFYRIERLWGDAPRIELGL